MIGCLAQAFGKLGDTKVIIGIFERTADAVEVRPEAEIVIV